MASCDNAISVARINFRPGCTLNVVLNMVWGCVEPQYQPSARTLFVGHTNSVVTAVSVFLSLCAGRSARNPLVSASEDVEMSNLMTSSNRSGSAGAGAADVESGECLALYSYVNSVRYCM
jgi:hypothetical protein